MPTGARKTRGPIGEALFAVLGESAVPRAGPGISTASPTAEDELNEPVSSPTRGQSEPSWPDVQSRAAQAARVNGWPVARRSAARDREPELAATEPAKDPATGQGHDRVERQSASGAPHATDEPSGPVPSDHETTRRDERSPERSRDPVSAPKTKPRSDERVADPPTSRAHPTPENRPGQGTGGSGTAKMSARGLERKRVTRSRGERLEPSAKALLRRLIGRRRDDAPSASRAVSRASDHATQPEESPPLRRGSDEALFPRDDGRDAPPRRAGAFPAPPASDAAMTDRDGAHREPWRDTAVVQTADRRPDPWGPTAAPGPSEPRPNHWPPLPDEIAADPDLGDWPELLDERGDPDDDDPRDILRLRERGSALFREQRGESWNA